MNIATTFLLIWVNLIPEIQAPKQGVLVDIYNVARLKRRTLLGRRNRACHSVNQHRKEHSGRILIKMVKGVIAEFIWC